MRHMRYGTLACPAAAHLLQWGTLTVGHSHCEAEGPSSAPHQLAGCVRKTIERRARGNEAEAFVARDTKLA